MQGKSIKFVFCLLLLPLGYSRAKVCSKIGSEEIVDQAFSALRDSIVPAIRIPQLTKFTQVEIGILKQSAFKPIGDIAYGNRKKKLEEGKYGTTLDSELLDLNRHKRLSDKIAELSPFQKAVLFKLVGKSGDYIRIDYIQKNADILAVAAALGLAQSSKFQSWTLADLKKEIVEYNRPLKDNQSVRRLVNELQSIKEEELAVATEKANKAWLGHPSSDYETLLLKSLKESMVRIAKKLDALLQHFPGHKKEIRAISKQWSNSNNYKAWISKTALEPRPYFFADVLEVRDEAKTDKRLNTMINHFDGITQKTIEEALTTATKNWSGDRSQDFHQLVALEFQKRISIAPGLRKDRLVKFSRLGNAPELFLNEILDLNSESNRRWITAAKPDLTFGENFGGLPIAFPPPEVAAGKRGAVRALVSREKYAEKVDTDVIETVLSSLSKGLLQKMIDRGYSIKVTRDSLPVSGLEQLSEVPSPHDALVNHKKKEVWVRTELRQGKIGINLEHFLMAVGRIIDFEVWSRGSRKFNQNPQFAGAYAEESKLLSVPHKNQDQFFAIAFAKFVADPEKTARLLPMTSEVLRQKKAEALVDLVPLLEVRKNWEQGLPFSVVPNSQQLLREIDGINKARIARKQRPEAILLEVTGNQDEVSVFARNLTVLHLDRREPEALELNYQEGLLEVSLAMFNNPKDFKTALNDSLKNNGLVIFIPEFKNIDASSPGFQILSDYFSRVGDFAILLLPGNSSDRALHALPSLIRKRIEILPLTPDQIVDAVIYQAQSEGYSFSQKHTKNLFGKANLVLLTRLEVSGQESRTLKSLASMESQQR